MLIRDIIAHLRHGDCGGRAGKVELLTGIEGVSDRPVGVEACSAAVAVMIGLAALPGSAAEMPTAENHEAVINALTRPLDTRRARTF